MKPPSAKTISPHIERLADLLDTRFGVPGTPIRFGLDSVIGLLPVAGDTVTLAIGSVMLLEAKRLGLGKRVMLGMAANLLIDWLIGLIPVADIVLDVWFKGHQRNLRLMREALARRRAREAKRGGAGEASEATGGSWGAAGA